MASTRLTILAALAVLVAAPGPAPGQGEKYAGSEVAYNQFVFAFKSLQLAQKSGDQRDMELATGAFDNFLGRFPEEPLAADALYYRALISHLGDNNNEAARHLARVTKPVNVAASQVHLLRGQVTSALGHYDQALEHLNNIALDELTVQVRAMVWLTRASCHRRLHRLAAGAGALEEAGQIKSPLQARALLELADVQQRLGQREKALQTLGACLALKDAQVLPEAAWLAGDLNFKLGRYKPAIEHFQAVVRGHPGSRPFAQSVVDLMLAQLRLGRHDAVIETFTKYRELLTDMDQRVMAWDYAATAHQRQGDHQTAAALLQAFLANVNGSPVEDRVRFKLAKSQFELGLYRAMQLTLDRLAAAHPNSDYLADADFLLARAAARQGKDDQAAAGFTAIINAGAGHPYIGPALHQRAWLYESHNKHKDAIGDYRRLLDERLCADEAQAHKVALRLVDLYAQLGRFKLSADQARRLLGIDRSQPANLDPMIEQEALYRWGWALIKIEQMDEAHHALATLLDRHPLTRYRTDALYEDGLLLMALGRNDEAVNSLVEALKSDKLAAAHRLNALRLSARHWRAGDKHEQAAQALLDLDKHSAGKGLESDERLWLGRYLQEQQEQGAYRQAIHFLEPLIGRDPNVPGLMRSEALLITARSLRGLTKLEDAIVTYGQVIAMADRFELPAWREMADTFKDAGRHEDALAEYAGLINHPQTRVAATAMLHAAQVHRAVARQQALARDADGVAASNEAARRLLLRLIILHSKPQISPLPQLARIELAEVEQDGGHGQKADQAYQELIDQFPNGPHALFAQAMLHRSAKQDHAALQLLRKLQDTPLQSALAQRVTSQLKLLEVQP